MLGLGYFGKNIFAHKNSSTAENFLLQYGEQFG